MLKTCVLAAFAATLACGFATASPIVTVTEGVSPAGLSTFLFTVEPGGLVGGYDTVAADTTIGGGIFAVSDGPLIVSEFNQVGTPNTAPAAGGEDSGVIPAATLFPGFDTSTVLSGLVTTPGSNNLSLGSFDFATVAFSSDSLRPGGTYGLAFLDNGRIVARVSGVFGSPIPEPAAALLVVACFASAARRVRG